MTCNVFTSNLLACADDEGVVRLGRSAPEIGGRATSHATDRLADAAFVYAQSTVDPLDCPAARCGQIDQLLDPDPWQRMRFLLGVAAVHRIGMCRLMSEGQAHGALVCKYPDVMTAVDCRVHHPKRGRRAGALERRVHETEG